MASAVPNSVNYTDQLPLGIEATSQRRLFFPSTGDKYDPTGSNIIRIDINYDGLLDTSQSYLMFNALEDSYGTDIYSNIIKKMMQGKTFWDTLFDITGDDEYSIKGNIEIFLDEKYSWMFLFNKYNFIFTFLPIILIFGYIYKRYKNKKLLRKWELEDLLEDLQDND